MIKMSYLLPLIFGFELIDGLLTNFAVARGMVHELNPFMVAIAGNVIFLPLKIVGALVSIVCLWWLSKRFPRLAIGSASFIVLLYGMILIWNFGTFFQVI